MSLSCASMESNLLERGVFHRAGCLPYAGVLDCWPGLDRGFAGILPVQGGGYIAFVYEQGLPIPAYAITCESREEAVRFLYEHSHRFRYFDQVKGLAADPLSVRTEFTARLAEQYPRSFSAESADRLFSQLLGAEQEVCGVPLGTFLLWELLTFLRTGQLVEDALEMVVCGHTIHQLYRNSDMTVPNCAKRMLELSACPAGGARRLIWANMFFTC